MIPSEFIENQVLFYYSSSAYFGETFEVVITRNKLYSYKEIYAPTGRNWIRLEVEEKRLKRFLDQLPRVGGLPGRIHT